MRLIVNALFVRPGVNGGTETYCNEICRQWFEGAVTIPDLNIIHYCTARPMWGTPEGSSSYEFIETGAFRSPFNRIAFEQFWLPRQISPGSIVFNPGYVGLLSRRHAQVVTIHDAYAWTHAAAAGRLRTFYWRHLVPATARRSAAVIAVSRSTKTDLHRVPGWPDVPTTIVHEAADHVHRIRSDDRTRRKINLRAKEYFLAVGVFKKIKNPEVLLSAYALYRERCRSNEHLPKDLVLCGAVGGAYGKRVAQDAGHIPGVRLAGRVCDSSLKDLYQHAAALVFVSKYEGFGIPILEAQELGCPVITGDCSSMPEVAGEGALIVPTNDPEALMEAMFRMHNDETTANLCVAGAQNCMKFRWEIAARQTLQILQQAKESAAPHIDTK